ncbi:MAG: transcriptional regulator, partial [Clostridiales bacterium]|nr:transcriptional regulator [Clostridiales bacterium]
QYVISAKEIKEFREPRLMTKFDHKINLPEIFAQNSLAILPITRGDYVISTFSAYKDFENVSAISERVSIPSHLQSLIPNFLFSESIALNCAYASGILSDFLEDDNILPTVNGRMSSGIFDFKIATDNGALPLSVNNSQIEIDAAYEGIKYISLFEAKKYLSDDFLVRQLYYPLRTWDSRVTKPIKTVFLTFSNGTFYLYQYEFEDMYHYNSLHLVKQKNYTISQEISLLDVEELIKTTLIEPEVDIAFPQANSMLRIINLMELLAEKTLSKREITDEYAFDERQTNYYTDAGRYLGLINKSQNQDDKIVFDLTDLGERIMSLAFRERQLEIVRQILKHRVFNETLKLHLQFGEMPNVQTIVKIMKESNLFNINSESTFVRRASTVMRWIEWILSIIEE